MSNQVGYSLIELLTVVGILGILLGSAAVHYDPRREDINIAFTGAVGDLRAARAAAITSGTHVAMQLSGSTTWLVTRLQNSNGAWVVAADLKRVDLPAGVYVSTAATPTIEFNTRGLVVNHDVPVEIRLNDQFGAVRTVTVWPSGEVLPG